MRTLLFNDFALTITNQQRQRHHNNKLMKKLVLTAVASLACVAAFAQGRVFFGTDSLHLVYYGQDPALGILAGQPVSSARMPAGINLVADLYMGTSSGLLSLYTTTVFSATDGRWNTTSVQTGATGPAIAGGTTVYIVTQIRDSAIAAPSTWTPLSQPLGFYYGRSEEFTFVLGTSTIVYPPMYAHNAVVGGGLSTWADGTYNMDFVSAGFRGAIMVGIPEPTSFALAALGAAAMLIFRRRK
jgi:PEP-CTERM motif